MGRVDGLYDNLKMMDGGECYEGVGEVVWRTVDLEKKEIEVEWEGMVRELVGERRVVVEVY